MSWDYEAYKPGKLDDRFLGDLRNELSTNPDIPEYKIGTQEKTNRYGHTVSSIEYHWTNGYGTRYDNICHWWYCPQSERVYKIWIGSYDLNREINTERSEEYLNSFIGH